MIFKKSMSVCYSICLHNEKIQTSKKFLKLNYTYIHDQ